MWIWPSRFILRNACRFTWEVIKRNRAGHAIILTTHSMEEADMLCDRIAIMAEGRLAAGGTPMDLKQRFGVGYRLTVVKQDRGDLAASGDSMDQERCVFAQDRSCTASQQGATGRVTGLGCCKGPCGSPVEPQGGVDRL